MPKLEAVEFCQQVCENCMFTCCSGNFDKSRKGELRCLTHPSSNVQFFKFVADVHRTTRSFAAALICTGQKMARNASQKMVRNSPEPSSSRAAQARNAPEPSLLAGASTAQILVDRHEWLHRHVVGLPCLFTSSECWRPALVVQVVKLLTGA